MKDNSYAVMLIVIVAAVAITAACMNNKDLLAFGSTVAGYGAALFQRTAGEKNS